ncbi:MAG: OmpA family protein [Sphingomonadales bacterium]|nr:OmpA family protein [Sphingomonadales bacterium]MDE2169696.1 OmpA family protein [Sphingomonadales bacterium]
MTLPGSLGRWAVGLSGLVLAAGLGVADDLLLGGDMIARMQQETAKVLAGQGVQASFESSHGWQTRHVALSGGDGLPDAQRTALAQRVAQVPGIGGVRWVSRHTRGLQEAGGADCAQDVSAILKTRVLRFDDNSAAISPSSRRALDEVAAALRPCAGSVIAITGHTDARGDETFNLNLSLERALAVRNALGQRGIDIAELRARGQGSGRGLPGLDPADPANRRIEFAMIAPVSVQPTIVDMPGADPPRGGDVLMVMPLWLELGVLAALTYAVGLGIGWLAWARRAG